MRMNRFDWFARFFRVNTAARPKVSREKREKATPKRWAITLPDGATFTRVTFTKSEARAMVKAELKLDRLPVGTQATKA